MSEAKPRPSASSRSLRALRALAVLVGAIALGPVAPAAGFFALTEVGGRLQSPPTHPAASLTATASSALSFAFAGGGAATAALAGLALAVMLLWKGRLGSVAVTRTAAFVAALASLWFVRAQTLSAAALLTLIFVLIAVATAQALYRLALSWRILPRD